MLIYKKALVFFLVIWAGILSTHPDLVFSIHEPFEISMQESHDWSPVPTEISFAESTLPIQEEALIDGNWNIAETAVSHLSSSAIPGENGNIILYSHNYPELFGKLKRSRLGETFTVKTRGGTEFSYNIVSKIQVEPDQVEWLQPTDSEVVTLYTCDGWGDERRLVIRAARGGE